MKTSILIVAPVPIDTDPLRISNEIRAIKEQLRRARFDFYLESLEAPRQVDVRSAMLNYQPAIVHFCGHGAGDQGLIFEDENGLAHLVDAPTLADFFSMFAERLSCVVLNACYTDVQARAISEHIDYVVGTRQAVPDEAPCKYSEAFYSALGVGRSIEDAHRLGCNSVRWADMEGDQLFSLRVRPKATWHLAGINTRPIAFASSASYGSPEPEQGSSGKVIRDPKQRGPRNGFRERTCRVFEKEQEPEFDVFLAYDTGDQQGVSQIASLLLRRKIRLWLDEWEIAPGQIVAQEKELVFTRCLTVAVFVGASGIGPWQKIEYFAALNEHVRRGRRVIPVLLHKAGSRPELPLFLQQFHWVDFRGLDDGEALARLEWGITGKRPELSTLEA